MTKLNIIEEVDWSGLTTIEDIWIDAVVAGLITWDERCRLKTLSLEEQQKELKKYPKHYTMK